MPSVEQRLAALERAVLELRQQQADTHTLAAHAGRDVAEFRRELRDQTTLLNTARLDTGDLRCEMRAGFTRVHDGMARIVSMLEQLGGAGRQENP